MANTGNFKTYERDVRYQTTQAAFVAGMYYTNTPIPEGTAKVLVNYDVSIDGASLKPRKGMQTVRIAQTQQNKFDNIVTKPEIVTSKACYQGDKEFIQAVVKISVPQSDDYRIAVYTIDASDTAAYNTNCKESHYYKKAGVLTNSQPIGVFNKATLDYTIHDTECVNKTQHVGCFINDQYFFFDKSSNRIIYTQFDKESEQYDMHLLEPQETPYSKAQQLGFNMLLDNPYTYTDTNIGTGNTITFNSINAFDDIACSTPAQDELIQNQLYYYRVSYSGNGTLTLKFDWTTPDSMVWQELATQTITISDTNIPKIVVPFRAPADKALLRCTASRTVDGGTEPVDVIWFSFEYKQSYTKGFKDITKYTLSTGTTMTYWQNRLVIAGVSEDKSYLFTSSPELFEYFPFPNNADYLEEPIIAVEAFLDNLLVFTKSRLYLYTLDPVTGLTRKCIQNNLNIKEEEAHLIKIVKNMAYFKSGNYYYMVVPKLNSTTGDLTIAPVYRYVKEFFDDFSTAVSTVLKEQYGIIDKLPLHSVHNYLDYESVHNVYMYRVKEGLYINVDLLYNTVKRTWSLYTYESAGIVQVYRQDATKPGSMLCLSHLATNKTTSTGVPFKSYDSIVQLIEWTEDREDKHLANVVTQDTLSPVSAVYNNNQFIDTGAIDISSNYKKRFREIQFRIRNDSKQDLNFSTTFFIDGMSRTPEYQYVPIIDDVSGTLTLDKVLVSAVPTDTTITGTTKLGAWRLSKAMFPSAEVIKIRIPVSGKGYNGQVKVNCNSQKNYTLLDITSVYRQLYSR